MYHGSSFSLVSFLRNCVPDVPHVSVILLAEERVVLGRQRHSGDSRPHLQVINNK